MSDITIHEPPRREPPRREPPRREPPRRRHEDEGVMLEFDERLPAGPVGRMSPGWWGIVLVVISEALIFAMLLFTYYYLVARNGPQWLIHAERGFTISGTQTGVMCFSAVTLFLAQLGAWKDRQALLVLGLVLTLALGSSYAGLQFYDWFNSALPFSATSYSSIYYILTGVHLAHAIFGLFMLIALIVWAALGYFSPERRAPLLVGATYWYFVVVVWIAIFITVDVTPYMMTYPG